MMECSADSAAALDANNPGVSASMGGSHGVHPTFHSRVSPEGTEMAGNLEFPALGPTQALSLKN